MSGGMLFPIQGIELMLYSGILAVREATMQIPVTRTHLANGLLILLKEIHTAPLISQWVWYRVGSRDEVTGMTGASHWVEHMQFKGTPRYPPGVLEKAIARDGGVWNAFTYLDWTAYFETLPADKIDLALRLEADRMSNSLFEPVEVEAERTVVLAERQGNENEPMFRLNEEVQAAAFRVHAYHHLTIGDQADLQSMSRDDLYQHYRTYYVPNNAVLAIAGDFETQGMLAQLENIYAEVPAGVLPPARLRPEPPQNGQRQINLEGPGETVYVQLAYHFPQAVHPDFFACIILDSLLTGPGSLNLFGGGISNKTSRLYRALVDGEVAVSVSGGLQATLDPFLHSIVAIVHPQSSPEKLVECLENEIVRLQGAPPDADELTQAVKQARALFAYGSETITNQAYWLGLAEMFASYEWFNAYLDGLAAVTPEDVQRVAQTYLLPRNRVLGIYLASGAGSSETKIEGR
jgi:zinc protease